MVNGELGFLETADAAHFDSGSHDVRLIPEVCPKMCGACSVFRTGDLGDSSHSPMIQRNGPLKKLGQRHAGNHNRNQRKIANLTKETAKNEVWTGFARGKHGVLLVMMKAGV